jgi:hypothetical protein
VTPPSPAWQEGWGGRDTTSLRRTLVWPGCIANSSWLRPSFSLGNARPLEPRIRLAPARREARAVDAGRALRVGRAPARASSPVRHANRPGVAGFAAVCAKTACRTTVGWRRPGLARLSTTAGRPFAAAASMAGVRGVARRTARAVQATRLSECALRRVDAWGARAAETANRRRTAARLTEPPPFAAGARGRAYLARRPVAAPAVALARRSAGRRAPPGGGIARHVKRARHRRRAEDSRISWLAVRRPGCIVGLGARVGEAVGVA